MPDIHGQPTPFVFLFEKDGLLHYRPDLQHRNIRFNFLTRMVESFYENCAVCVHSKELYVWDADTLRLIKTAEMDLGNDSTTIYEINNGRERLVKKVKGTDIYDTALFKIY
jgi:hypothetical protein